MNKYSQINTKTWSIMGANGVIGVAAMELAELNENIMVLTADQSLNSGLTRFKKNFPNKYINMGISEQNMINVAAGLAKEGFNPFVTAQAPFMSMRSTDQVRVSLGYMKLGVKILGLSAGFSQGEYGATHHCINDLAIMRSIPNLVVLSPADCTATYKFITAMATSSLPVYIRLTGVTHNPIVYKEEPSFKIGGSNVLKSGTDITILATGTMVKEGLKASELLEKKGFSVKVVDMYCIKPIDKGAILDSFDSKMIFTIEEHSIIGGLGGAVSEILATYRNAPPLSIIGAMDAYIHADEYHVLLSNSGLIYNKIANRIEKDFLELNK